MKKYLIIAVTIFCFSYSNAQSNLKGTMHANAMLSVLTGSANNKIDGFATKNKYTVRGTNFGAQFQYALQDSFSVGIGLESNTVNLIVNDVSNNLNDPTLNLIKVSLSGRFYLLNKDKVNIFAGPTVGYTSGRDRVNDSNSNFSPIIDTETRYSGLNYGLNAGCNYYFTERIGLIVQLSYELTNVKSTQLQTGLPDLTGTTKINGLNIGGGLAFKF